MVSTRTLMHGSRPLNLYSVFDFEIADYEIQGGFCQLQLDVAAYISNGEYTVDWGDGTIDKLTHYRAWHDFTKAGRYRIRIGPEVKQWRLWECYTRTSEPRTLISRPAIFPICWGDFLESCKGTYCGWTNPDHGGVQGKIIPWGRSIKSTFCCYQFCRDVTGAFPPWTETIEDASATYDGCTNLRGPIPKWGRNIKEVAQCFCNCPGVYGRFPKWPPGCWEFSSCFKNATGMHGEIPPWPIDAKSLHAAFDGCRGAVGNIPPWPVGVTDVSYCYRNCANLTGAWTDDPAELMPEEKLKASPTADWYRCYEVVLGCSETLRSLFWDKEWGGTIPRPQEEGEVNGD